MLISSAETARPTCPSCILIIRSWGHCSSITRNKSCHSEVPVSPDCLHQWQHIENSLEVLFNLGHVAELICALDMPILQLDFTAALRLTACYKFHWSSVTLVTPTTPSVHYTTGMAGVFKIFLLLQVIPAQLQQRVAGDNRNFSSVNFF